MPRARQGLIVFKNKKGNKKSLNIIYRKSIGTFWINGVPITYDSRLVYHDDVTIDQIIEDSQRRGKKVIIIKRR